MQLPCVGGYSKNKITVTSIVRLVVTDIVSGELASPNVNDVVWNSTVASSEPTLSCSLLQAAVLHRWRLHRLMTQGI